MRLNRQLTISRIAAPLTSIHPFSIPAYLVQSARGAGASRSLQWQEVVYPLDSWLRVCHRVLHTGILQILRF